MKSKQNIPTDEPLVSKSQRRRDALELKTLAGQLIKLQDARLGRVPLDEDLREAIMEARAIRSNVARKRQLQYVAKLLRRIDPEVIVQALEEFEGEARKLTGRQHRSEAWRDFLIEQGDSALGELLTNRPYADSQAIRQLVRNTRKERSLGKPPASARALFRLLRDMDEEEQLPPVAIS